MSSRKTNKRQKLPLSPPIEQLNRAFSFGKSSDAEKNELQNPEVRSPRFFGEPKKVVFEDVGDSSQGAPSIKSLSSISDYFPINPQDEPEPRPLEQQSHSVALPLVKNAGRDSFTCVICLDDIVRVEDTAELSCHHRFCKSCVTNHVRAQLDQHKFHITCLNENCDHDLAGELPTLLPSVLYQQYLDLKSCASQIHGLKQCPTPDCPGLYKMDPGLYKMDPGHNVLECHFCKTKYCVKCSRPAHKFFVYKQLLKENRCKQCPECQLWVDKIGVSNHMTCRCKFEFCFQCSQKWAGEHEACQLIDRPTPERNPTDEKVSDISSVKSNESVSDSSNSSVSVNEGPHSNDDSESKKSGSMDSFNVDKLYHSSCSSQGRQNNAGPAREAGRNQMPILPRNSDHFPYSLEELQSSLVQKAAVVFQQK